MKKAIQLLNIFTLLMIFFSCTDVTFDNPYDPDGTNKGSPMLQTLGNDTLHFVKYDTFIDTSLIIIDDSDSDSLLMSNLTIIIINSSNDTLELSNFTYQTGIYKAVYIVKDSENNISDPLEKIIVVGELGEYPGILLRGPDPYRIRFGQGYSEFGAFAIDAKDGDITENITVIDSNNFTNSPVGFYYIGYQVIDSDANKTTKIRTVLVHNDLTGDTTLPKITIYGPNPMVLEIGAIFEYPSYKAIDDIDGDITNKVEIIPVSDTVNTKIPAVYNIYFTVTDNAGNTAVSVFTVTVSGRLDTNCPVIYLHGNNPDTISQGKIYIDSGGFAVDNIDDTISFSNFDSIIGLVDISNSGVDSICYIVYDEATNRAESYRIVVVIDSSIDILKPVITVHKSDSLLLPKDIYKDSVTAYDDKDGDITHRIVPTVYLSGKPVSMDTFTNNIGCYNIVYTVSDTAGNMAVSETVSVIVSDTGAILFDNFELVPSSVTTFSSIFFGGNGGVWFTYVDDMGATNINPNPRVAFDSLIVFDSIDSSKYLKCSFILRSPDGLGDTWAGIGFNIKNKGDYFDFSMFEKLTFFAKGSVEKQYEETEVIRVRVNFYTEKVLDEINGGSGYGHLGMDITLDSNWQQIVVTSDMLAPVSGSPEFNQGITWDTPSVKDKVSAIEWFVTSDNDAQVNLNLDNILIEGVPMYIFR